MIVDTENFGFTIAAGKPWAAFFDLDTRFSPKEFGKREQKAYQAVLDLARQACDNPDTFGLQELLWQRGFDWDGIGRHMVERALEMAENGELPVVFSSWLRQTDWPVVLGGQLKYALRVGDGLASLLGAETRECRGEYIGLAIGTKQAIATSRRFSMEAGQQVIGALFDAGRVIHGLELSGGLEIEQRDNGLLDPEMVYTRIGKTLFGSSWDGVLWEGVI